MATQFKVIVQDENGAELGSRTLSAVETLKIKHKFAGTAKFLEKINEQIDRLVVEGETVFLREAAASCDEYGLVPDDWSNGVAFALMKKWYEDERYQDAEARGL